MIELQPREIEEQKLYQQWGLSEAEFDKVQELLGRLPNFTETGLFAAMWSEHCAYKNSKPLLKQFPTTGKNILQGPGEGAGIIDIGDGQAVVFKAESHNHPTAVEPYQGAATGVGGIIRDIFSMGARPIAMLDSLHFGPLDNDHTKYLIDQTVAGIGDYGNCIGIPTVGGEMTFEDVYQGNPLMNGMCVGLLDSVQQQKGAAAGAGNLIFYVGAKTGRDGIQGAIFASAEFNDEQESQRSAVQVGDPFAEKMVMEACLDLIENHADILVGIQDMGAAGLVSSSAEMGAKAGFGMDLNLDLVPQREADMIPYELMLSESQERMLLCIKKGHADEVIELFNQYETEAVEIGTVRDDQQYILHQHDEVVANVDVKALVDEAPVYRKPSSRPARLDKESTGFEPDTSKVAEVLMDLLQQPAIASKESVYHRYDSQVQTNTVVLPGSDAAVIRVRNTDKALAMTTDANPRYLFLDPHKGGQIAVAEAARNIVASGGMPLGITDCLNFGSPEDPEIYYELEQATKGMSEACRQFETPVISGNVSLYNEFNGQAIYPTPMVGMVGLIESMDYVTTQSFKQHGDLVYLVGETKADFNGTEIQKMQMGQIEGQLFDFDLATEAANQQLIQEAIRAGLVNSVHDLAEGGLAVAIAESTFDNEIGVDIKLDMPASWLFSETQSRFIVSVSSELQADFEQLTGAKLIGTTGGQHLAIQTNNSKINLDVTTAKKAWKEALAWQMK
ncbi:phosphoribosylformylglycinamidine synthase domain-containing protein [Paucilactobacillus oligofermentans DSM 15707 = LMG 22743]|uniref:Phosphoribosylformylglycinamidine synthase subunit PurL n=1 Tax=Paucilactobacillus oligofermentans DSM 15707 = LMG 22743 TaxID=1423778 RepID=A0A0R1RPU9_9LACO|nr:phosphoribosylformylglycinamidine synthase subunit PurL [Paucilactobacillus oligofermentans]KRL55403.1 phosphoribosylformylglycinamidine synthase domain-containing protein [Paucilactobacillus oligofermentans DSM 15707 = LMG 22743]CUS25607.1 Phosphoribosylformylglycinamidine synthase 2 PurL [Paucilactobacillus oligofermentans DSM 15707 = LMG 22743]